MSPSTSAPFALPPLASHAFVQHGGSSPRLVMPLPQRAVPVDESDESEIDSERGDLTSHPTLARPLPQAGSLDLDPDADPDLYLDSDRHPASISKLSSSTTASASALVSDEHGELARVRSPRTSTRAYPNETHRSSRWPLSLLPTPSTASTASSDPNATPALLSAASIQIAFWVGLVFVLSTAAVIVGLISLPVRMPANKGITSLSITEIRSMSVALQSYAHHTLPAALHTWVVLLGFFTWKQAWTVPGSIVMNVFLGMMYGTYLATLYTSIFTATGGVLCYLLCRPVKPIIEQLPGFQRPLDAMRRALDIPSGSNPSPSTSSTATPISPPFAPTSSKLSKLDQRFSPLHTRRRNDPTLSDAASHVRSEGKPAGMSTWMYLLLLRLVPIVPWGAMNICCAVLGVPLWPYWASFLLGSVPWNFVTTQVGEILQGLLQALPSDSEGAPGAGPAASSGLSMIKAKIWSPEMVFKLVLLTIASLLPMGLQWWVKSRRAPTWDSRVGAPESMDTLTHEHGQSEDALLEREDDGHKDRPHSTTRSGLLSWPRFASGQSHTHEFEGMQLLPKPSQGWGDTIRTPSPFGQLLRLSSPNPLLSRGQAERTDVESSPSTEEDLPAATPNSFGSAFASQSNRASLDVSAPNRTANRAADATEDTLTHRTGANKVKPSLPPLVPLSPSRRQAIAQEWSSASHHPARTPSPMQTLRFARDRENALALAHHHNPTSTHPLAAE